MDRQTVDDFGLPPLYDPKSQTPLLASIDADAWRLKAVAALLLTEADMVAESVHSATPPGGRDRRSPIRH
jgi:hypothetical protein